MLGEFCLGDAVGNCGDLGHRRRDVDGDGAEMEGMRRVFGDDGRNDAIQLFDLNGGGVGG